MPDRFSKCPRCGSIFPRSAVRIARPFECPHCGGRLCVSSVHWRVQVVIAEAISFGAAYVMGFRGLFSLGTAALLGLLPAMFLTNVVAGRLVTPTLRPYHEDPTSLNLMQPPQEERRSEEGARAGRVANRKSKN
jgi:DNA-directed RNA polymerase subunit RPC12/RpoP